MQETIKIIGATENNLKNITIEIPKKKITVFTGVSGSGKSSLCLDTIAGESRRELNETFPSYVQQYLPKYGRPVVEKIENLPVTIVIDQKEAGSREPLDRRNLYRYLFAVASAVLPCGQALRGVFGYLLIQSSGGKVRAL